MKKALLLLAASAFATASFAQTTPHTEVTTRDNGTKKIVTTNGNTRTVTKTGKTNVGAAISNSTDAAENVADKTGHKVANALRKGARKTKSASYKASSKLKKDSKKMEAKSE